MKKFLPFLASLFLASVSWGQTGNGVLLLTDASYTYTPTTVDSSMTFNLSLKNDVGIAQIVYFGGLDAPFELSSDAPIEVPSQDTVDFSITFTPSAIGTFSDTLEVIGSIFGEASLVVSGDGIQVNLEWTPDTLSFNTTPIGQTDTQTVELSSVGDGAAVISDFQFSNDIFSVDSANTTFSIAEGESGTLSITFAPTGAGVFEESVTFETNDPNNQFVTITLHATSISEVSGSVCNATWTFADSPFTLVGDIHVPEGCALTIEPGVVINGQNFMMDIQGEFVANGTGELLIDFNDVLLRGDGASIALAHGSISGSSDITTLPTDSVEYVGQTAPEFSSNVEDLDVFYDDFEDYTDGTNGLFSCDNTSSGSDYSSSSTGGNNGCSSFYVRSASNYSHSGSKSFYWDSYEYPANIYYEQQIVAPISGTYYLSHGLKVEVMERSAQFSSYYRINSGSWIKFYESPSGDYEAYGETSSQLDHIVGTEIILNAGDVVELYFRNQIASTSSCYDNIRVYIDDIRLTKQGFLTNLKSMMYSTEGNWSFETEFSAEGWSVGCETCYDYDVYGNSEYVEFRTRGCSTCGYDEWLQSPPVTVERDGLAQFEWQEFLTAQNYYWRPRIQASVNGGSYFDIYVRDIEYCESSIVSDYNSWNDRYATIGDLNAGDVIRLRLNPFQNQGNSWDFTIRFKDLELYTIPLGYQVGFEYTDGLQIGDMLFEDCDFAPLDHFQFDSTSKLNVVGSSAMTISNSLFDQMSLGCDTVVFSNSSANFLGFEGTSLSSTEDTFGGLDIISADNLEFTNSTTDELNVNQSDIVATHSTLGNVTVAGMSDLTLGYSNIQSLDLPAGGVVQMDHVDVTGSASDGIKIGGSTGGLQAVYSRFLNNAGDGIDIDVSNGQLNLNNCVIAGNGGRGIYSNVSSNINYMTIADNGSTAVQKGSAPSQYAFEVTNSILTLNGGTTSGSMLIEYNYTENYPQFADDEYHLQSYSPAVDAAMPWHTDQNMPFGMGGLRADMGAYGGPENAGWGGEAAPSGSATIATITDTPQDQGNAVGIEFDASAFDNSLLEDNITNYAFWRHYDPTGQSIGTLDEGNWELIGEMPAQSFNGYAYQAQTLGNTNAFGTFNSCFTVVAHTDDPDTYWYSNVLCGESVDNLAPSEPDLGGMVLETGGVTVFWELPSEEDYAYTEVMSDAGFTAEVTGDTLAVDLSAELGGTYTYTAVHYDVNGNASDPASLTLELEPGVDVITLNAGWNLISTDRAVTQGVDEVFAGLAAGNLQYVTSFDGGVQFYDPNGLSFLNTLGSLTPGNGYWVKVAADDVLEVSGVRLAEDFMPGLAEGWNLVGYAAEAPAAPGDVFAELEATGDLLYVTGFDEGVEVYDPNGLPFLNTLTEMRNGFGYWVKSAVATDGDVLAPLADDVLPAELPTPRYDVVNGVSELGAYAGDFVDVVNGWGVTVARLPILEGGHLMTTALFGDDPATGAVEGLADGEELHFAFRGAMANETLVFGGDMAHKTLSLTFDEVDAVMGVFPNPASDVATFRFQMDMDAQVELTLVDLAGRQVAVLLDANKGAGAHAETLALPALEAGAYTVQLRVAGEVAGTQRLVVTH